MRPSVYPDIGIDQYLFGAIETVPLSHCLTVSLSRCPAAIVGPRTLATETQRHRGERITLSPRTKLLDSTAMPRSGRIARNGWRERTGSKCSRLVHAIHCDRSPGLLRRPVA